VEWRRDEPSFADSSLSPNMIHDGFGGEMGLYICELRESSCLTARTVARVGTASWLLAQRSTTERHTHGSWSWLRASASRLPPAFPLLDFLHDTINFCQIISSRFPALMSSFSPRLGFLSRLSPSSPYASHSLTPASNLALKLRPYPP